MISLVDDLDHDLSEVVSSIRNIDFQRRDWIWKECKNSNHYRYTGKGVNCKMHGHKLHTHRE